MSIPDIATFSEDSLNLRPFAERLEKFILVERQFVDGGLVLTLGAPFGAGKTTFLRMWQADLESRRKEDPNLPRPVVLNAWESDFCGDPLIAIVTGLLDAVESHEAGKSDENSSKLRAAAKDAAWFATGIANSVVAHVTGVNPIAAGEFTAKKNESRKPKIPDIIRLYQERTGSLETLKVSLQKQFGGTSGGAIIMVDELDRCRPDYAVSYLETIKHVFNVPSLIFVLAVDYQRLAHAAKSVFGELNFDEYYRKFVHRTVHLPAPDKDGLAKLARVYVPAFLEKESIRVSLLKIDSDTIDQIVELIGAFHLTPRQIQEVFRIIGHVLAGVSERRGRIYWCIGIGVILMSVLKVGKREIYEALGKGGLPHFDLGQLLVDHVGKNNAEWWFSIYITGILHTDGGAPVDLESLYKKLGFIKAEEKFDRQQRLSQFAHGWGRSMEGQILRIHSKIEEIDSF